jgi:putative DNA methylase
LRELEEGAIAPVDLPQAAIGPGMAVFTRYAKVIESDGTQMRVRSALARINEVLDEVLNEQEGDFDATTRFAIAWFRQYGYATGRFGDADNLARARNTSVDALDREGILLSRAGKVALIRPSDLPSSYDPLVDPRTSTWEVVHHLIRVLEADGIDAAGQFLALVEHRPDAATYTSLAKELAYLLYSIADSNKLTKEAIAFNNLATSWNDIVAASRSPQTAAPDTLEFPDEEA